VLEWASLEAVRRARGRQNKTGESLRTFANYHTYLPTDVFVFAFFGVSR
jgi:hypothetical protein